MEGLKVVRTEPGPPDDSGRRSPLELPGSENEIGADLVVSAIGQRPDLSFLDGEFRDHIPQKSG